MNIVFNNFNKTMQGLILVACGTLLLFYTLGLLGSGLNILFICAAIGIIVYGLMKLNVVSYWHKAVEGAKSVKDSFKKKK
jgi:dipeptide/tripeptide permease